MTIHYKVTSPSLNGEAPTEITFLIETEEGVAHMEALKKAGFLVDTRSALREQRQIQKPIKLVEGAYCPC